MPKWSSVDPADGRFDLAQRGRILQGLGAARTGHYHRGLCPQPQPARNLVLLLEFAGDRPVRTATLGEVVLPLRDIQLGNRTGQRLEEVPGDAQALGFRLVGEEDVDV